jgi:hypothetical protein
MGDVAGAVAFSVFCICISAVIIAAIWRSTK